MILAKISRVLRDWSDRIRYDVIQSFIRVSSPENHTANVNTFEKLYDSRLLKQFSLYLKKEKRFCFQIFAFGSLNAWQFGRLKKRNGYIWLKKGPSGTLTFSI